MGQMSLFPLAKLIAGTRDLIASKKLSVDIHDLIVK